MSPLALALATAAAFVLAGCGGGGRAGDERAVSDGPIIEDPGPEHVHGLGINPADRSLFIATHTGLFRAAEGQRKARRVADRYQDTMAFTIVGADRFLGSGHPDGREGLPPFLGLIRSRDAGESWRPLSLQGRVDFHVLEQSDGWIYGFGSDFDTRREHLMLSRDGGRTWRRLSPPERLISLAVDPRDRTHVVAAGEGAIYESRDAGTTWRDIRRPGGLVAWPAARRLYLVEPGGGLRASADGGRRWREVSEVGGPPAAFEAVSASELYVALHDGVIKRSLDAGASFSVRSAP